MTRLELEYRGSAESPGDYPRWALPEIALAGRSNAGKSSLLNAIGGRRGLARVSRTPGRTQRIHFFSCTTPRGNFALVDLPGYGFARAPREARERWGAAVERYLVERENLRALVLLCDVRREPQEEEREVERFAEQRGLRLVRVATKVDKLGRSEAARRLAALGADWIGFSARTGEGRERLVRALIAAVGGGEG